MSWGCNVKNNGRTTRESLGRPAATGIGPEILLRYPGVIWLTFLQGQMALPPIEVKAGAADAAQRRRNDRGAAGDRCAGAPGACDSRCRGDHPAHRRPAGRGETDRKSVV